MKSLFLFFVTAFTLSAFAQDISRLPAGRYEGSIQNTASRWEQGDLVLLDDFHYKTSNSNETGEYRFSATAQRVFFISGYLKGAVAKTKMINGSPAIHFPFAENQQVGVRIASGDLVARLRN
jgi:hypothetical protein